MTIMRRTLMTVFAAIAIASLLSLTTTTAIAERIRNAAYDQCIYAPGGAENVQLRILKCSVDPNDSNAQWSNWTLDKLNPTDKNSNIYILTLKGTNYCMEVKGGSSSAGERVDARHCNQDKGQQWEKIIVGNNLFRLKHVGTDQCLDTVGGHDSNLMQWTCGNESPGSVQTWSLVDNPDLAIVQRIRNAAYDQCIYAPGGAENVQLRILKCSVDPNDSNAKWSNWILEKFDPIDGGSNIYLITLAGTHYCMEVNGGSSSAGERVDAWHCNRDKGQQWEKITVGNNLFRLRHVGTDQCLDTVGGHNSNLMQWTCGNESPGSVQTWSLVGG